MAALGKGCVQGITHNGSSSLPFTGAVVEESPLGQIESACTDELAHLASYRKTHK